MIFKSKVVLKSSGATLAAEPASVPSQKRGLVTSAAKGDGSHSLQQSATSVVATCAGFPKVKLTNFHVQSLFQDMVKRPSTVLNSGVYGDDACFISRFKNTFVVGELIHFNCNVIIIISRCRRRRRGLEKIRN